MNIFLKNSYIKVHSRHIFQTVESKCVSADVRYMSEVGWATVHDPAAAAPGPP